ncbi:transglutaminase TgpA family protein [Cellulomonas wangsupingiae]|uniref:DUF3488 and transglutaminase-like domain-containing protein n=1 Tax=Cellulomonas wangsupingiae TaxID=2968085 RepID=A0ABY5K8H6_9CELL|nr:DUF3488 and transglutaminase-like domain-containing protein [Cellulomonas wangsupingiae]MCC2335206.1 DUF3488 and transglutaminase-like domain-containing protein [Cellulomonas wangsupingiae]UUI66650.1 DUF3488 and transglutaminase-like domain-containing protein [Cellulomonas wangsupingiae]
MTPGPERGGRVVVGSALAVLATWSGLLALTGLVAGRRWLLVSLVAVLVVAGATGLARAATRTWWVPTAVGAFVALVGLVLRYGAPPGRPQFLPDLDAVARAWTTARQGVQVVNDSYVPMPDVRPGEMLVVIGALAVYLLVDAAVLTLRVPAVSGVALLALWIPAIVLGFPAGAAPMFWTACAYLALLAYGAAPLHAHAGRVRRICTATVTTVVLACGSLLAGPPLMDLPGWASVALPTFGDGPVGPLELSDDLDLRESLGARSGQVVLTYRVSDPSAPDGTAGADSVVAEAAVATVDPSATPAPTGEPTEPTTPAIDARLVGPLRAFTLTTFDGRLWERTDNDQLDPWDPAALLASDPQVLGTAPDPAVGSLAQVDVEVGALRERRLPVSTFPRTVAVGGDWGYDPLRDEVVGERATSDGLTYSMLVQVPTLTAQDLRGARVGRPTDADLYTALPGTEHREDIAALAAQVTEDSVGPYDQALDLQTWLRSAANFTYDTRVPPARTSDAVWDFLEDRRGYCVQFATAMAMMARTLDIPSRVGVGFLPGQRTDDGEYVVTGRLAHAWPELYFDGLGWVRFEPTPASQSGPPPVWADPFSAASGAGSFTEEVPQQQQGTAPTAAATAPATVPSGVDEETTSWVPVGVSVALVLLVAGAASVAALLVRRRRRWVPTPEHAWWALRRELARLDVRWSDATSPRGVVRQVDQVVAARTGRGLAGPPRDALERLARAVERARYAPTAEVHTPEELDAWVRQVRDGVRDALTQAAAPEPARIG